MYIREAREEDNEELQQLQARCPQGTTLVVSTVNTPDFFARAKAYSDYRVYVAVEDNHIVGPTACALRTGMISGKEEKVGHVFQAFVNPEYRGRRIAGQMHQCREEYLRHKGAPLAYSLIIEGNIPSIHYISREGFQWHRTMVMPCLLVLKDMAAGSHYELRTAIVDDLPLIAGLVNETWLDCELYEPRSAEALQQFIIRTPGYDLDNLFVLQEDDIILACLGFWDWSQVMKITVGDELLRQIMLTPIGFRRSEYLTLLLEHVNNVALQRGIGYIYCICEHGHSLLSSLRGFTRIDTAIHVYIKYLRENTVLGNGQLFIDGVDL